MQSEMCISNRRQELLQRSIAKTRSGERGFTLIELLIVIVILGILAAIVVFAVGGITDRGQDSACKTEESELEVAVEAYFAKHGAYPGSVAVLLVAPDKYLRSAPVHYNTDGSGNVTGSCP